MKGDDLRLFTTVIRFENNEATITNTEILLKLPVADVLGSDEVLPANETFFIKLEDWKNAKADKAIVFSYVAETKLLHCVHKGGSITFCPVHGSDLLKYPDVEPVIPSMETKKVVESIGVNTERLATLVKIWGGGLPRLTFFGGSKPIRVCLKSKEGIGLIVPLCFSKDAKFPNDPLPQPELVDEAATAGDDDDDDDFLN